MSTLKGYRDENADMVETNIARNLTVMAAQITGSLPSWAQLPQLKKVIAMPFTKMTTLWGIPVPWVVTGLIAFICILALVQEKDFPHTDYPLQNPRKFWDVTAWKSKWDFIFGVRKILEKRIAEAPDQPYRILTDFGDMTILPPDYANEIRNSDDLSFDRVVEKVISDHACSTQGASYGRLIRFTELSSPSSRFRRIQRGKSAQDRPASCHSNASDPVFVYVLDSSSIEMP